MRRALILTLFFSLSQTQCLFSQKLWIPEIEIKIPAIVYGGYFGNIGPDSNFGGKELLNLPDYYFTHNPPIFKNYVRNLDTITVGFGQNNDTETIHFIIDSTQNMIIEFDVSYIHFGTRQYPYESDDESWKCKFNSLKYFLMDDSTLKINDTGIFFRKQFDTATYYFYKVQSDDPRKVNYHGESQTMVSTSDDTNSFSCKVTFHLRNLKENVLATQTRINFLIFSSLFDNTIHFSIPSTPHSQSLFIYDILGKEAARAEIPAGAAEYTLPTSRLASGHYFARLGNMSGHFEVSQ